MPLKSSTCTPSSFTMEMATSNRQSGTQTQVVVFVGFGTVGKGIHGLRCGHQKSFADTSSPDALTLLSSTTPQVYVVADECRGQVVQGIYVRAANAVATTLPRLSL